MASPRLAGIRQPGLHIAGAPIGGGGGGGGGATTAALTTLADAGEFYSSTDVEGALNEVGNSLFSLNFTMTGKADVSTLASHAAGAGAARIGIQDAAGLITATQVEAALQEIAYNLANFTPSGTIPLTQGGTGQITAAAAFDALTVTAPSLTAAATVDLSLTGCPGHYAVVNGATGITSFGAAPAGTERILRFASTPLITHNATSLILPGAANIVAAAGDVMFVHSLGSGNWRCTTYTRAASMVALVTDLASVSAAKGASLIGIQDAGGLITATTVEGALAELAGVSGAVLRTDLASGVAGKGASLVKLNDVGGNFGGPGVVNVEEGIFYAMQSAGFRARTVDLADTAAGKGASLIGLQDAGNFYPTDNVEAALAKLGPYTSGTMNLVAGQNGMAYLLDGGSGTTPDLFVYRHKTTGGTAGVGMGFVLAGEVWDSGGGSYRAWTDTTAMTNVTGGTLAAKRTFSTINLAGNGVIDQMVLGGGGTNYTGVNFPVAGTATTPCISFGAAATKSGIGADGSGFLSLICAGVEQIKFASNSFTVQTPMIFPVSNYGTVGSNAIGAGGVTGFYFANSGTTLNVASFGVQALKVEAAQLGAGSFPVSTEGVGFDFIGRSRTWVATTGTVATQREFLFRAPTYVGAATPGQTFTTAATVAIAGPPVAGTFATIPTPLVFWTQNGVARHDISDATQVAPDVFGLRHLSSAAVAIGSGITSYVDIADSVGPISYRASEDIVTMTNVTGGTQASRRAFGLLLNNVMTKSGGFGFNSATYPMVYVGDPASNDGFRRVTAGTRIDLMLNNTVYWAFGSTSECFAHVMIDGNTTTVQRLYGSRATVASANVLTLGTANVNAVTGTTTIKGIATASWTPGSRVSLELPSGIIVNHADGTMPTGGGVAILLRAAANLTTSAVYQLDLVFNGTNWIQPG